MEIRIQVGPILYSYCQTIKGHMGDSVRPQKGFSQE